MGVFGRKSAVQTEELTSDQATREITASQLAEVLSRVDGDRQSDAFEHGDRVSGTRPIESPRSSERISDVSLSAPTLNTASLDSTPQLPVVDSTANVRVVTAHQNTRAMTIALVLALATFFAAIVLAYRY